MENKKRIIDPEKTKELQKDWQDFGKTTPYYGLVVLFIFIASLLYQTFIK